MKKPLRHWAGATVGAVAALAFTSCAYEPYSTSVGGSYSSGYGQGYGYGGSNFTTSVFVSTGNPQWGYDPHCYSYYDYHRRCYYDPYLNGYYPMGYRPPVVVGCPHPYGWSPGRSYCPPPRYVKNVTVVNYNHRETNYRNTNYSWSKQVRQKNINNHNVTNRNVSNNNVTNNKVTNQNVQVQGPDRKPGYNRQNHGVRQPMSPGGHNTGTRPTTGNQSRPNPGNNTYSQGVSPGSREKNRARTPAEYNTPVKTHSNTQVQSGQRNGRIQNQPRQSQPAVHPGGKSRTQSAPQGGKSDRREQATPTKEEQKKIRALGQG